MSAKVNLLPPLECRAKIQPFGKMIGRRKLQRAGAVTQRRLWHSAQIIELKGSYLLVHKSIPSTESSKLRRKEERPSRIRSIDHYWSTSGALLVSLWSSSGQRVKHYWCVPLTYTGEDDPILTAGRDTPIKTRLYYETKCYLWEHLSWRIYIIVRARERSKRMEAEERARASFADCGDKMGIGLPYYR